MYCATFLSLMRHMPFLQFRSWIAEACKVNKVACAAGLLRSVVSASAGTSAFASIMGEKKGSRSFLARWEYFGETCTSQELHPEWCRVHNAYLCACMIFTEAERVCGSHVRDRRGARGEQWPEHYERVGGTVHPPAAAWWDGGEGHGGCGGHEEPLVLISGPGDGA